MWKIENSSYINIWKKSFIQNNWNNSENEWTFVYHLYSEKTTTFEPRWNWSLPRISRSTVRFVTRQTWKKTTDPTSQISFAFKDLMTSEFCGFFSANDFFRWWNNEIFFRHLTNSTVQERNSLPNGSPTTLLKQTILLFSFGSLIWMAMLRPFHLDAWYFHWTWPRDCNRRPSGNKWLRMTSTWNRVNTTITKVKTISTLQSAQFH